MLMTPWIVARRRRDRGAIVREPRSSVGALWHRGLVALVASPVSQQTCAVGQSVGQMPFLGRNFGSCKFGKFLKSDFKNRGALRPLRLG
jgi:hypothetical protein